MGVGGTKGAWGQAEVGGGERRDWSELGGEKKRRGDGQNPVSGNGREENRVGGGRRMWEDGGARKNTNLVRSTHRETRLGKRVSGETFRRKSLFVCV